MTVFAPNEQSTEETRAAMTPQAATKLAALGLEVKVESGLGVSGGFTDDEYRGSGAGIVTDRAAALREADIVLRVTKPVAGDVTLLKRGAVHLSYLDPFNDPATVQALASAGVTAVCMELIPRSTIAQKMDALSSQANLGGYVAVMLGANKLNRIFPMMSTPSGTIAPAKIFIIGAGVAGLQAIATARRLGAIVEAFDTRPVVEEQVKSLGAKFVKVDLGDLGQTAQGYARELTAEQLEKQRSVMAEHCAQADLVITTAQVFGRKAPRILTTAMVQAMKPGSVVVDMAVESGGNVECSRVGEEVAVNGVHVLGHRNLPGRVPRVASEMYANNLVNFITHFWDRDAKSLKLDAADEIVKNCVVTRDGAIIHEGLRQQATGN
jgi:NAD(P) transhydrogenase subunit alpha